MLTTNYMKQKVVVTKIGINQNVSLSFRKLLFVAAYGNNGPSMAFIESLETFILKMK